MAGLRAAALTAAVAALVAVAALAGAARSISAVPLSCGRLSHVLIEVEGNAMGNIPSISSSCITAGNAACIDALIIEG